MNLISDFAGLFFPDVCHICGNSLFKNEQIVCTPCYIHFPETNFHDDMKNPVARVFWGRVPLEAATALYYYRKGGSVQKLIHLMKYNGHKDIGIYFGNLIGSVISETSLFDNIDCVLPIPLHRKKLQKRGFNQAELIAKGINEVLNLTIDTHSVIRNWASDTQTKKSRYTRWENVGNIFKLQTEENIIGKHILVVDDVITTGATMEACLNVLLQIKNIKLSVVSVAFAHQ